MSRNGNVLSVNYAPVSFRKLPVLIIVDKLVIRKNVTENIDSPGICSRDVDSVDGY